MLHDAGPRAGLVRHSWRATAVAWLIAAAAGLLCTTAISDTRRSLSFRPDRLEKCDFFLVTEFSVSAIGTGSADPIDDLLFSDSFGIMRNIDSARAVGLTLDAHVARGLRLTPNVRFKQWLSRRSSIDLTLGYAHASVEDDGVFGWIGDVRYSPAPWFHVRTGVCRIREVYAISYLPDRQVNQAILTRFHAGVGVGEVPGVIAWGGQVLLFATFVALFSGMS